MSAVGSEVNGQMTFSIAEFLQQGSNRLGLVLSHVDGGQSLDIANLSFYKLSNTHSHLTNNGLEPLNQNILLLAVNGLLINFRLGT